MATFYGTTENGTYFIAIFLYLKKKFFKRKIIFLFKIIGNFQIHHDCWQKSVEVLATFYAKESMSIG